jgi:hypothetical protein
MDKIHQTIFINAPREKLWNVMLSDASYRDWTSAFNPGSYYKGEWKTGSKILFLGPGFDGNGEGGMVSEIEVARPYEFVSIAHKGLVMNGVEDTTSEATKGWAGSHENYTFTEKDGGTELAIDVDILSSEKANMESMWVKGLARLKELAEK